MLPDVAWGSGNGDSRFPWVEWPGLGGEREVRIFVLTVLGPACAFLLYVLMRFGWETYHLRIEAMKHQAAERLLEVSARRLTASERPDSHPDAAGRTERDNGILVFPAVVKQPAGRRTA
jgi:hypothetical protein